MALIPRGQLEAASGEAPPSDFDETDEGESTLPLCQLDEPAKATLRGLELEHAGVPYWTRGALSAPLDLAGVPNLVEFRVPAWYIEEARSALRRVEEWERGRPIDDAGS